MRINTPPLSPPARRTQIRLGRVIRVPPGRGLPQIFALLLGLPG